MRLIVLLTVSLAALLAAAVPRADGSMDRLDGGGSIVPPPEVSGPSHFEVGAASGALGENSTGHITDRFSLPGVTTGERTFHGDVGQGCLRASWNRAIVVGKLPSSEQVDYPGLGRLEYVALVVEDDGNPVGGQPVDRAVDYILRPVTAAEFCTIFDPATAFFFPLAQGNFVAYDALIEAPTK
jgi:hypothetical protein